MAGFNYRNRAVIRSGNFTGAHISEALDDISSALQNVQKQANVNLVGPVTPPAAIGSLTVTANNTGFVAFAIQDNSQLNNGITYHIEMSLAQQFSAPVLVYSGPSRNPPPLFIGNHSAYFRGFSQYPASNPSAPVYFGTANSPTPVAGGGGVAAAPILPSAGSGSNPSGNPVPGAGFGTDGGAQDNSTTQSKFFQGQI